jgi:peptidoglycan/xylan/chitin deacetylase (PgdA/CDA1 family)
VSILIIFLLFIGFQQFRLNSDLLAQSVSNTVTNDKVVILNFDDGRKTQFTEAKPILDKYGYKATFYVVCNYVGNKPGYMNWKDVNQLNQEGHDIGSHSMNHIRLDKVSNKDVKFEVGQSRKCLEDHNIEVTSFAYPFNAGSNDKKVVNIVSKYYDLARTAGSPLTYLHCDGWTDQSNQKDCRTLNKKDLTFANRYSIRGWSHDMSRLVNSYSDKDLLNRFIQVVNSQSDYNKDGKINAIPIIIYHRAGDDDAIDYNTDLNLFKKEMKYLHDNNFRVLTMKDLGYKKKADYLYVKSPNELSQVGGLDTVSAGN